MELSRHGRHIPNDPPPRYRWATSPSISTLPVTVLPQGGANTQPIFHFDDIPSGSPESIPSRTSFQRGRSRWSPQTRFAHDHRYHTTQHVPASSHYVDPPTYFDPHRGTPYPQTISEHLRPAFTDVSRYHKKYPRDEYMDEPLISSSPASNRSVGSSYQSFTDQPLHSRAYGLYEQSLAPHLDWREVEISAAIRRQDMGQPTSWSHPSAKERSSQKTHFASSGRSPTGRSGHMQRPVIGRCEACGYKDYLSIVQQHKKNCSGRQYK